MTVGIDIRVLARGARTGVEEYTINLLSHILPLEPKINYKLFYNAYQKVKLDYSWLKLDNVELIDFRIPNRLFFVSARYFNSPKIDKLIKGIDIYFNPHFFISPLTGKCKKVAVFHDLSFEHYPEFFSWRKRAWQNFLMNARQTAEQADKIIAVSESTKEDLIDFYNIDSNKIKVVYSGVGKQFNPIKPIGKNTELFTNLRRKYKLPEKFILYFGTIEPRKNIKGLIKAFELLKDKEYKLVIAGEKGWLYDDIFKTAVESKRRKDIVFTGFIEEKDKPYLYNLSDLFVYPSFFEGFGFPPLEAMACGVPTIVSCNSSLPEVAGNAALMINPDNIDEMSWSMEIGLKDNRLRNRLIKRGLDQTSGFSWQKCAEDTLDIISL